MKLCFTPSAWDDYVWFQEHDRKLLKRINRKTDLITTSSVARTSLLFGRAADAPEHDMSYYKRTVDSK